MGNLWAKIRSLCHKHKTSCDHSFKSNFFITCMLNLSLWNLMFESGSSCVQKRPLRQINKNPCQHSEGHILIKHAMYIRPRLRWAIRGPCYPVVYLLFAFKGSELCIIKNNFNTLLRLLFYLETMTSCRLS